MTERSIVEAAARLRRHGEPYLVATVVCVTGAGFRRPGARMILTRFRWVAGQVSGGCLEGDISSKGWSLTRDGASALLRYDTISSNGDGNDDGTDDDDIRSAFGLGCDGVVEVLLERTGTVGRIDALEFAARCLHDHKRGAVTTVFRSDAPGVTIGARLALIADGALEDDAGTLDDRVREQIAADMREAIASGHSANRSYATAGGTIDVLIEAVLPPPRLILCGTGHDAVPVATLARSMGWDVIVCSSEAKYSTRERFAMADEVLVGSPAELAARIGQSDRAVAVVMNHNVDRDRASLAMLLGTKLQYIGVLGPRDRTRRLLRELAIDDEDPRVVGPIGLDLGAETAAELALAIVAELQAIVAGTSLADVGGRRVTQPYPSERVSGSGSMAAMAVAAPRK